MTKRVTALLSFLAILAVVLVTAGDVSAQEGFVGDGDASTETPYTEPAPPPEPPTEAELEVLADSAGGGASIDPEVGAEPPIEVSPEPEAVEDPGGSGAMNFFRVVSQSGVCNHPTLQSAVNSASSGDLIISAPGIYDDNVNIDDKNLTIFGGNSANCAFVLTGAPQGDTIFTYSGSTDSAIEIGCNGSGLDQVVLLSYVTVANTDSSEGNIRICEGTLTMSAAVSRGGNATSNGGGGIQASGDWPTVINLNAITAGPNAAETLITGNTGVHGGGIWTGSSNVNINMDGARISANQAASGNGGGMEIDGGRVNVHRSFISFNNAGNVGGGFYLTNNARLNLRSGSRVFSNSADNIGGGAYLSTVAFMSMEPGTRLSTNSAPRGGGAGLFGSSAITTGNAALAAGGNAYIEILSNNATGGDGGGFWHNNGNTGGGVYLYNAHFANNTSTGNGALAWMSGDSSFVTLDTIGAGCGSGAAPSLNNMCVRIRNNDAGGNAAIYLTETSSAYIAEAGIYNNDGASNTVDADVLYVGADADADVLASLFVNNGRTCSDGANLVSLGTLDAVGLTFAGNDNCAIDHDGGTTTTSRILTDRRYNGGSYAGICNVKLIGNTSSVPDATAVPDLYFTTTTNSNYEVTALSSAVDICPNRAGGLSNDVVGRGALNGKGFGAGFDAGAFETPLSQGVICDGNPATHIGTVFADVFSTGGGQQRYAAGPGDDVIDTGGGNDVVCAGSGNDTVDGGTGDDRLFGNGGQDDMNGEDGNDYVDGGAGNDRIFGAPGNDVMYGRDGSDWVVGGNGNDRMWGGTGDDRMGGNGNDDMIYGEDGNDRIWGGSHADIIDGGAGNDEMNGLLGPDEILGGSGNDIMRGDPGNDLLDGGTGNDTGFGGDGWDTLFGRSGNDVLNGGGLNDTFSGGPGTDICRGNLGVDNQDGSCETTNSIP